MKQFTAGIIRHTLVIFIFVVLSSFVFCEYVPSENTSIRFGNPGGKGRLLKKTAFTLMYDSVRKCPLWASYRLDKKQITTGRVKPGSFKPDKSLKAFEQTQRNDYPAKVDKCPMVPVLDMAYDPQAYRESFLLSNTCPMNPLLKRFKWRELEDKVRKLAVLHGSLWVVTGPIFDYKNGKIAVIGSSKIAKPTGFFKVILYQAKDYSFHSAGFYMDNAKQEKPLDEYMTSVDDIESRTGLDFFNLLPAEVQVIMEKAVRL